MSGLLTKLFFLPIKAEWLLLKLYTTVLYSVQCSQHDLRAVAPHTALWGGHWPRYESWTGDLEAGTLTTRPSLYQHTSLTDYPQEYLTVLAGAVEHSLGAVSPPLVTGQAAHAQNELRPEGEIIGIVHTTQSQYFCPLVPFIRYFVLWYLFIRLCLFWSTCSVFIRFFLSYCTCSFDFFLPTGTCLSDSLFSSGTCSSDSLCCWCTCSSDSFWSEVPVHPILVVLWYLLILCPLLVADVPVLPILFVADVPVHPVLLVADVPVHPVDGRVVAGWGVPRHGAAHAAPLTHHRVQL